MTNSGTLELGSGESALGLTARGDNNTLTNQGTIDASGFVAVGLDAFGDNNTLINRGTIEASGVDGFGLFARGVNNTLINRGTVTVDAPFAEGLSVGGDNNTLINRGTVAARSGEDGDREEVGIGLNDSGQRGESSRFTNAAGGTVTSEQGQAVLGGPGNERVVNAGTLSGNGTAVDLAAGDDTLQLETTSVINGVSDGGADIDELILSGSGQGALDLDDFLNFETLRKGTRALGGSPAAATSTTCGSRRVS